MSNNKIAGKICGNYQGNKVINGRKCLEFKEDMEGNVKNISIKQDFDGKTGYPAYSVKSQINVTEQNSGLNYKTVKVDVKNVEIRISFTNDKPNNIIIGFKEDEEMFPMTSTIINLDSIIKELNSTYASIDNKIKPAKILKRKGVSLSYEDVMNILNGITTNDSINLIKYDGLIVVEPAGLCSVNGFPDTAYEEL
ncbi:hypothetical protein AALA22_08715 [Anaerovoracaceae bacterium 41-7]